MDSLNLPDVEAIAVGAPIVTSLVQVAKTAGLPDRLGNSTALVFGIAVSMLLVDDPVSQAGMITAVATGLTATGLYEGVRTIAGARIPKKEVAPDGTGD